MKTSIIKRKGGVTNAQKPKREPVVPREVLRAFIKDYKLQTAEDVQNALKDIFADTLQEMLEAEMDTALGYEKYMMRTKTPTQMSFIFISRKCVRLQSVNFSQFLI